MGDSKSRALRAEQQLVQGLERALPLLRFFCIQKYCWSFSYLGFRKRVRVFYVFVFRDRVGFLGVGGVAFKVSVGCGVEVWGFGCEM